MEAAALDDLEGAGQAKRLTARICAEVHNAIRNYAWSRFGEKNSKPPKSVDESQFLPVRFSKVDSLQAEVNQRIKTDRELHSMMNSLCGF
jgi:hypothetical protein